MCYYVEITQDKKVFIKRFDIAIDMEQWPENSLFSGFAHPLLPLIYNDRPHIAKEGRWGLKPFWAKPGFEKNTLNAKIETITEKPAFRNSVQNRCLVLVDAFFEWKWLDEKGKTKQKYRLSSPDGQPFALAGIWTETEAERSFSIITTEANALMAEIHNTKKRMPVVLKKNWENHWLQGGPVSDFKDCSDVELSAEPV